MIKTLTRHGNSYALIIEKPILELLNMSGDTPLEITTDGKALIVRPAPPALVGENFLAALEKVNKRHGGALKRLAE